MVSFDEKAAETIYSKMLGYRTDAEGFMVDVLGLNPDYIWSKMRDVWEGIQNHQFVAVRAGHSVSKTYGLGRTVNWFKTCFQPSTVITTAPSDNQVRNQLWREIHAAYAGAKIPLGGKMTSLQWNVKPSQEVLDSLPPDKRELWEKNFAIGFSTSPDSATEHATKMQGWHNEWVLVVLDEACGIMPQIWRTVMEGLIVDEQCKVIAIGNPTDPECEFAKACHSSDPKLNEGNEPYISDAGFYVVTIAATDTPNYKKGKRVIPGLAGRDYVDRIVKKYGPDGDGTRIRVKGLFPTCKEGTYYGSRLALARKEGRVGRYPHDPTSKVYTFNDFGDVYTATAFVQFIRQRIHVIDDYWDYDGMGITEWARVCDSKPYVYGGHFAGYDFNTCNAKSGRDSRTTKDFAAGLGYDITAIGNYSFNDGIEAARSIWPILDINETAGTFLSAMAGYGKTKNQALSTDEQVVYHDHPAKTWHRHMADALRHLGLRYRFETIGDTILGYTGAEPEWIGRGAHSDNGVTDLQGVG